MGPTMIILAVALLSAGLADADHLEDTYPFNRILNDNPSYKLYWKVNLEEEEINFAVKAETEGWVGFGLSVRPTMIGSDVVIGWIANDSIPVLHVSYPQGHQ